MIIKEDSKVLPYRHNVPTRQEFESLHIPKQYHNLRGDITRLEGEFYHMKFPSTRFMINELIGSYLSKRIELDTVDYEIGVIGNCYIALSKVFYEEGYRYLSAKSYLIERNRLDAGSTSIKFRCLKTRNLKLLQKEACFEDILKLIAVDLKMGQSDRHGNNVQMKIDGTGTVSLAPIYDYGCSYMESNDGICYQMYANPFVLVRRNPYSLGRLFRKYPSLQGYMHFLNQISIEEILGGIEQEKRISFEGKEYEYYQKKQGEIDEVIQNIKIKRIF